MRQPGNTRYYAALAIAMVSGTIFVYLRPTGLSAALAAVVQSAAVLLLLRGMSVRQSSSDATDAAAALNGLDEVARLRHDMITPANAVHGFATLLAGTDTSNLTQQQRKFIDNIVRASHNMLLVIEQSRHNITGKHDGE